MKRCELADNRIQDIWKYYGLGVPSFVIIPQRKAVARCNEAIVKVLHSDPEVLASYEANQKGGRRWYDVLVIAETHGFISSEDVDICFAAAKRNGVEVRREVSA